VLAHLARIESPPAFRLILDDAHVVGDQPVILTGDRVALAQSAFAREHLETNTVLHERLPLARRLDEAAIFVGPWHGNWFHWVTDHLPRLALLPLDDEPDLPVLVHADLTRAQLDSLEYLGLSRDRMVGYSHPHVRVRRAVWPSLPGRTGNTPPWAANWLRDCVGSRGTGRTRLYVRRSRSSTRGITNEHDVVGALVPFGIETVEPEKLTFEEQMAAFASAELIVGAHGAGLTNIVAARDAALVEAFDPRYVNGCYYALADALGHRYWYLMGSPDGADAMTLGAAALARTVEAALSGTG
jgi:capsular polysaccharide biosynthesis protein